jgi:hypothetical protein
MSGIRSFFCLLDVVKVMLYAPVLCVSIMNEPDPFVFYVEAVLQLSSQSPLPAASNDSHTFYCSPSCHLWYFVASFVVEFIDPYLPMMFAARDCRYRNFPLRGRSKNSCESGELEPCFLIVACLSAVIL